MKHPGGTSSIALGAAVLQALLDGKPSAAPTPSCRQTSIGNPNGERSGLQAAHPGRRCHPR